MRSAVAVLSLLAFAVAGADAAVKSVMLISIDGMHPSDLANQIKANPNGALARLSTQGTTYTNVHLKNAAADSFPGTAALLLGGTPITTGIWYDDSYDRSLSPPLDASALAQDHNGTKMCSVKGTEVLWSESIDSDNTLLNGGNGTNIALLPLNGSAGCKPVFPNQWARVNNIFQVVKDNNGTTAWSDKHTAAYQFLRGPSNTSLDTYYSPEVAAVSGNMTYIEYDQIKGTAFSSWIQGKNLSHGQTSQPTLFGGDLQAFNQAQNDGYKNGTVGGFTSALSMAMNASDELINGLLHDMETAGTLATTAIIIAAKHGQNPLDPSKSKVVSPDTINGTISAVDPNEPAGLTLDSAALIWLRNQSNLMPVVAALQKNKAKLAYNELVYGSALEAGGYGNPMNDSRVPDIIVKAPAGVQYTDGSSATDHGGFSNDDTNLGLLITVPGATNRTVTQNVTSTQVAASVLQLLGLSTSALDAARIEGTKPLPGLPRAVTQSATAPAGAPASGPVGSSLLAPLSAMPAASAPSSSASSPSGSASTASTSGSPSSSPSGAPGPSGGSGTPGAALQLGGLVALGAAAAALVV